MQNELLVTLTADIVSAHVANNDVPLREMGRLIGSVHGALASLGNAPANPEIRKPAVPVKASVRPSHVVCLECGLKLKTLKRHLASGHGLTPFDYRVRYGLAPDYPMIAPDYAQTRRELAKQTGLGRFPRAVSTGRRAAPSIGRRRAKSG